MKVNIEFSAGDEYSQKPYVGVKLRLHALVESDDAKLINEAIDSLAKVYAKYSSPEVPAAKPPVKKK